MIVADMIVCGEREGPIAPSHKAVGMIAVGTNNVCFDEAICTLMGFDPKKIPAIQTARAIKQPYQLADRELQPRLRSNEPRYDGRMPMELKEKDRLHFLPTKGWGKWLSADDQI